MQFYSGFSLKDEAYLFDEYIQKSNYSVSGFSYGAIKAFEYVQEEVAKGCRIDTLQLFSPAFFQTKDEKFKRFQLMSYRKNNIAYIEQFIAGCFMPYEKKIISHRDTSLEELQELLEYRWERESLEKLLNKGVKIEVYLGGMDAIIDVNSANDFFVEVATLTYIKDANHFLQIH